MKLHKKIPYKNNTYKLQLLLYLVDNNNETFLFPITRKKVSKVVKYNIPKLLILKGERFNILYCIIINELICRPFMMHIYKTLVLFAL